MAERTGIPASDTGSLTVEEKLGSPTLKGGEVMDWADNLDGVKELLDKGPPGGPQQGSGPHKAVDGSPKPLEGEGTLSGGHDDEANVSKPLEGGTGGKGKQPYKGLAIGGSTGLQAKAKSAANIWDRAGALIQQRREANHRLARDSLGDRLEAYETVKNLVARTGGVPILKGGTSPAADVGSYISNGDGRISRVLFTPNFAGRKNVTYSFDAGKLRCASCVLDPGHRMFNMAGGPEGGREVVFLTDQAYPACLRPPSKRSVWPS